ncbi:MAG: T9SS type A sorting domain-containing protein [Candidatus Edwardsbacteria bacterium]
MKKIIFTTIGTITVILIFTAGLNATPPTFSGTTVWPDTNFNGPFPVKSKITAPNGIAWDSLYYNYGGGFVSLGHDSTKADTFYFTIPQHASGGQTPITANWYLAATENITGDLKKEPATAPGTPFSFKFYIPRFTNTTKLRDTTYTGPFVVQSVITAPGGILTDSLFYHMGSFVFTGVGADSAKGDTSYFTIPQAGGGVQTPITVYWCLAGWANSGGYYGFEPTIAPSIPDTFKIYNPQFSNTTTISDTAEFLGPFLVQTTIFCESSLLWDSLYCDNGSGYVGLPHDSIVGNVFFYTIPQQSYPVKSKITISWYIQAVDSATADWAFEPPGAGSGFPFRFSIYDGKPPTITNTTQWPDTSFTGPFPIYANVFDTSGIGYVRLYYKEKAGSVDSLWHYLPMFPTGNPQEYSASIPAQFPKSKVYYYVEAQDSAEGRNNIGRDPNGAPANVHFLMIGDHPYSLLLIDDDEGTVNASGNGFETYYQTAFDSLMIGYEAGYYESYDYWDMTKAEPFSVLRHFKHIVWFTTNDSTNTITPEEQDSLIAFLNRGGKLFVSSKQLGQEVGVDTLNVFYNTYLNAKFVSGNAGQIFARGVPGDSIGQSLGDTLALQDRGGGTNKSLDKIFPRSGADSCFVYRITGGPAAIKYDSGTYKVVYFAFPFEAIGGLATRYVQQKEIMDRIMRWFGIPTWTGVEELQSESTLPPLAGGILLQNAPNPFRSETTIRYHLPGGTNVSLKVYNVLGQLVKTLVNDYRTAGAYSVRWNGKNDQMQKVSSGVYFYRLETESGNFTKKMVLIR